MLAVGWKERLLKTLQKILSPPPCCDLFWKDVKLEAAKASFQLLIFIIVLIMTHS